MTQIWLWTRNLQRGDESSLVTDKSNAIRTNNIKAKIDNMHQNNKCRICGNRDDNGTISECIKLQD